MKFKLGDIVEYHEKHSYAGLRSTVIGLDSRDDEDAFLIGWKETNEITGRYRPNPTPINKISIISTDLLIANLNEYAYGCWEIGRNLNHANLKGFTKVRKGTLRKRMRDQMAQEIYKCRE